MLIREIFRSDITRPIRPVAYFHEQSPEQLADEVSEYIITGGWPQGHPNHRRIPNGIHEQYVRLLSCIASELERPDGPGLPNVWVSGFYGCGKSSFAKLLGFALDGVILPDGVSLAEAWLQRDTSPLAGELRAAFNRLLQKVDPLAVVFDLGATARDHEHIHTVALRQVQTHLGYCSTESKVADFELKLERDGEWSRFDATARETLGQPWEAVKDRALALEDFSRVMSVMYPNTYTDPMSWRISRAGAETRSHSPEEAVLAMRDMLKLRRPGATLFLVVDEVSQYVLASKDRVDRLRAFATALGSTLKGQAWLIALGQQSLDEENSCLTVIQDRFPAPLRLHLAPTNIRDVVHQRLLLKKTEHESSLRELFERHRPDLKLFAYDCASVSAEEFVASYPMLPGQTELILQITSALLAGPTRNQSEQQATRGLLQLLGDVFREQKLADASLGSLVTLDMVYEVQHGALDTDVQDSMTRLIDRCAAEGDALLVRAAKCVALLELIQDRVPTEAKLVAQCLYDRVDRGNQVAAVSDALEELRRRGLLGYSERAGYKVQSSTGEAWELERRDIRVSSESIGAAVQDALKSLMSEPERPRLQGRVLPWAAVFSDGGDHEEVKLLNPSTHSEMMVDFRFLDSEDATLGDWVRHSCEAEFYNRIVWVSGEQDEVLEGARGYQRSIAMVKKYRPRRESLSAARRLMLSQEESRAEDLRKRLQIKVAQAWMGGTLYFRGRPIVARDQGESFDATISSLAARVLPDLYPRFVDVQVQPAELSQLLAPELSGPSKKFLTGGLGILELDSGRYLPSCRGVVPDGVADYVQVEGGVGGKTLLLHFGRPPYGYPPTVVKACIAGLLRAGRIRVQPEEGGEITNIRDVGVQDLFDQDRAFHRSVFFTADDGDISFQTLARICKFFEFQLGEGLERDPAAIADAVAQRFPQLVQQLRQVFARLDRIPNASLRPAIFLQLHDALLACIRNCRQTTSTVKLVKTHLATLGPGIELLQRYDTELSDEVVDAVCDAHRLLAIQVEQLQALGRCPATVMHAAERIRCQIESKEPWQNIASIEQDLQLVHRVYVSERESLLRWQERQVELARGRVKQRSGFSRLDGERAHQILGPLRRVATDTSSEAIRPDLSALEGAFAFALRRAEDRVHEILDEVLGEGEPARIVRVDLSLRDRELQGEGEVDALVQDIRSRLMEQIDAGLRVRLR